MKKLKLELDRLKVQSFVISRAPALRGTVRAHGGGFFTFDDCPGATVIAHYCHPDSNPMDCVHDGSHNSCGCVTPP